MNYVLDSSAVLAYLRGEAGGEVALTLLSTPSANCYMHAVNLCEVHYIIQRRKGYARAEQAMTDLFDLGVVECKDMDTPFWKSAASLKARGNIALPDCFCVVLAQRLGAKVVTADRTEFAPIVELGTVSVQFIR
ncbi:MAG: type II toxin-antitoxin system VapC family toxin [Armatimonadetes bacterium]|nr:type II toxin-antitoxin system VapC family toxin [Armatimonadota bacterium]